MKIKKLVDTELLRKENQNWKSKNHELRKFSFRPNKSVSTKTNKKRRKINKRKTRKKTIHRSFPLFSSLSFFKQKRTKRRKQRKNKMSLHKHIKNKKDKETRKQRRTRRHREKVIAYLEIQDKKEFKKKKKKKRSLRRAREQLESEKEEKRINRELVKEQKKQEAMKRKEEKRKLKNSRGSAMALVQTDYMDDLYYQETHKSTQASKVLVDQPSHESCEFTFLSSIDKTASKSKPKPLSKFAKLRKATAKLFARRFPDAMDPVGVEPKTEKEKADELRDEQIKKENDQRRMLETYQFNQCIRDGRLQQLYDKAADDRQKRLKIINDAREELKKTGTPGQKFTYADVQAYLTKKSVKEQQLKMYEEEERRQRKERENIR